MGFNRNSKLPKGEEFEEDEDDDELEDTDLTESLDEF